jgi:hypothetical protein
MGTPLPYPRLSQIMTQSIEIALASMYSLSKYMIVGHHHYVKEFRQDRSNLWASWGRVEDCDNDVYDMVGHTGHETIDGLSSFLLFRSDYEAPPTMPVTNPINNSDFDTKAPPTLNSTKLL